MNNVDSLQHDDIQNNIDVLDINLSSSGLAGRELVQYFNPMPTLKTCRINLANLDVTDEILEYFIRKTLINAKNIYAI